MDAATAYESSYTTDFKWPNGTVDELKTLETCESEVTFE